MEMQEAMARAIEQIEQYLLALDEAIAQIAQELYNAYFNYLTALGQALRQQFILATYHLCTQGYPDSFLRLSLNQRQQLQHNLQNLAIQAQKQLLAALETGNWGVADQGKIENIEPFAASPISNPQPPSSQKDPEVLAQLPENLEGVIAQILKSLSHDSNHLLQQAGILPQKLPEPLLDAAAKANPLGAPVTAGPPNLLNVKIEPEINPSSPHSPAINILAINLRLTEIELADSTVMAGRNQIRNLLVRFNTLKRDYQKKQRERRIAEAEAAWRSSWVGE